MIVDLLRVFQFDPWMNLEPSAMGKALVYGLAFLWAFWYMIICNLSIYRLYLLKRLSMSAFTFGAPAIIFGLILDVLLQYTVATVFFFDLPAKKERLVTQRLTRYIKGSRQRGWRYEWACWICHKMLDAFDPSGVHCTYEEEGGYTPI